MIPCARCGAEVAGERDAMPVCPPCNVEILTEHLACVQAEHSLDKATLADLAEQLAIAEVNKIALQREKDALLVKLQSCERSMSRVTGERDEAREAHAALIRNYADVMDERNAAIVLRNQHYSEIERARRIIAAAQLQRERLLALLGRTYSVLEAVGQAASAAETTRAFIERTQAEAARLVEVVGSCKADIVFAIMYSSGKTSPFEIDDAGEWVIANGIAKHAGPPAVQSDLFAKAEDKPQRWTSHFALCKQAPKWRK